MRSATSNGCTTDRSGPFDEPDEVADGLAWGLLVGTTWLLVVLGTEAEPGVWELAFVVGSSPLYGVAVGAVTAIVYNSTASLVGGVELDLGVDGE